MNDAININSTEWDRVASKDACFRHRRLNGIPDELHDRPILYASAHVGNLPEEFAGDVQDQRFTPLAGFIDAKAIRQDALIDFIAEPCRKLVETKPGEPDWTVCFKYFEPLDSNGNILTAVTTNASMTFAIFHDTYEMMLPQLAELLRLRGILSETEPFLHVGSAAAPVPPTID